MSDNEAAGRREKRRMFLCILSGLAISVLDLGATKNTEILLNMSNLDSRPKIAPIHYNSRLNNLYFVFFSEKSLFLLERMSKKNNSYLRHSSTYVLV